MKSYWKWICAVLGLIFIGPFGLLLGFFIGAVIDTRQTLSAFTSGKFNAQGVQRVFFDVSFEVMGFLAKCDGRVTEREIAVARAVMLQMGLNDAMRQEAIQCFNRGKQSGFDLSASLQQLKQACWRNPSILRLFIEIQMNMAFAEGQVLGPQKQDALNHICQQLGINPSFIHQFRSRYSGQQYTQASSHGPSTLKEAYDLLEIKKDASDSDVKKAYRRQMSQNHPDKLMAKGVPPEMIKLATQKTQKIKDAYEHIKKTRGIS